MHYELYKQQEDVLSEHPLAIYTGKQPYLLPTSYYFLPTISAIYPTTRRMYVAKGYRFAVAIPSDFRRGR